MSVQRGHHHFSRSVMIQTQYSRLVLHSVALQLQWQSELELANLFLQRKVQLSKIHDRLLRNFSAGQQSFRWLAFNLESISPLTHWNAMFPNPGLTKIHLTNFNSLSLNGEMVHIFSHCAHRAINYNDFYSIVYWVWVLTHWFAQSVCLLDNICDTGPASLLQT